MGFHVKFKPRASDPNYIWNPEPKRVIKEMECPTCGAVEGTPCPHDPRIHAARIHAWQIKARLAMELGVPMRNLP